MLCSRNFGLFQTNSNNFIKKTSNCIHSEWRDFGEGTNKSRVFFRSRNVKPRWAQEIENIGERLHATGCVIHRAQKLYKELSKKIRIPEIKAYSAACLHLAFKVESVPRTYMVFLDIK